MATLTDAQTAFLRDNPFYGVVTTLRPDGSPHATVVWVDVDDAGNVWFNTARGRVKPTNLERDPRLALTVIDPGNPYQLGEPLRHGRARGRGRRRSDRQAGEEVPRQGRVSLRTPEEKRVGVRITAQKVDSAGFDGGH